MIIYHSDDYGINRQQSDRILACRQNGVLNSVSIMPNSRHLQETVPLLEAAVLRSIHINLCEGHCVAPKASVRLLTDQNGYFHDSFLKLCLLSVVKRRELKRQLITECTAQIKRVCAYLPADYKLRLDSHRHYHMIPLVFEALYEAALRVGRPVEYVRWPAEPWYLYLLHGSLLKGAPPVNMIKTLVLDVFSLKNARLYRRWPGLRRAAFLGILYSNNMSAQNVRRLLPVFRRYAGRRGLDLEVLFHPGGILPGEEYLDRKHEFAAWYESPHRVLEQEALTALRTVS